MRVLVCGSRTFRERWLLNAVLDGLRYGYGVHLIHGGATGADQLAASWGHDNAFKVDEYKANWEKHGRAAGPRRNLAMLQEGNPDVVVAFVDKPLAESKGTAHMVAVARAAGVRTYVVDATP